MRVRLGVAAVAITTVTLANAACSGSTKPPSNATVPAAKSSDLDPTDAAFVSQLRSQGLLPSNSPFPDAAFVTDAQSVCNLLAIPGESATIKATDMVNTRNGRVRAYGITTAQANEVMVLSAQTYCPAQVGTVKSALG